MRRITRSPSATLAVGSLAARAAILVVLVAAAGSLRTPSFETVAYLIAVTSAIQALLDPGAGTYLVSVWPSIAGAEARSQWRTALLVQCGTAAGVCALPILIGSMLEDGVLVGASLGAVGAAESLVRFGRSPWLASQRFRAVAGVDGAICAGRLVTALGLVASGSVETFAVANMAVAVALLIFLVPMARSFPAPAGARRVSVRRLMKSVWPFATFWPALYGQGPVIVIGVFGEPAQAALYAVVTRLTQPTELLPLAIANAHLPKLARSHGSERREIFRHQARIAVSLALGLALAIVVTSPISLAVFHLPLASSLPVLVLLAVVLIPKFLNYQLVMLAVAEGKARSRFRIAAALATLVVPAAVLLAPLGALAVAGTVLVAESLMLVLLSITSRLHRPFGWARPA